MAMGRGICKTTVALSLLLIICMLTETFAVAHTVGDAQGWGLSISYADWANKISFATGDTLVFNYQAGLHNVVSVNAAGYKKCKASGDPSKAASTGKDKLTLKKGANYFICSLRSHCQAGMKIQVVAN